MYEPAETESIRARVFVPFTLTVAIGNVPSRLTFVVKAVWACTLQIDVWCRPSHLLHDFLLRQALTLCSPDAQLRHSRFFHYQFLSLRNIRYFVALFRSMFRVATIYAASWFVVSGLKCLPRFDFLSVILAFLTYPVLSSHCSCASNSSMKPHFRQLGSVLTRSHLLAGNFSSARDALPLTLLALPMVCKALTATLSLA